MVLVNDLDKYRDREIFTRHGGCYDRGSADAYYGREVRPHYFTGASYQSTEICEEDMSEEEIFAYLAGYEECTDRKDWGEPDLE